MPEPTNRSPETAITFSSLPYSMTYSDIVVSSSEQLWFKYVPVGTNYNIVSLVASQLTGGGGRAWLKTFVYVGTPGDLTPYLDVILQSGESPLTVPLWGHPAYYFQITRNSAAADTMAVTFQVAAGALTAAPPGSIAINDAEVQFPLTVISSVDGTVYQSFPFANGDRAAVLPDGTSLWHDNGGARFMLYNSLFTFQRAVEWLQLLDVPGVDAPVSTDNGQLFYVACNGTFAEGAYVRTISRAGDFGPVTWRLPITFVFGIAPSWDGEILYYVEGVPGADIEKPIRRFNLGSNSAMSDLAAGVPSTSTCKDLLVFPDGSVVAGYRSNLGLSRVRRYDSAGTLLWDYEMAPELVLNRMAHAVSNDELWVWSIDTETVLPGRSRFDRLSLSTGLSEAHFYHDFALSGSWSICNEPLPTEPLQTHSRSCPFILTRRALPTLTPRSPIPPGGGTGNQEAVNYGVRRTVTRRLRRAPHISAEQTWIFHKRFQLDLQAGVGTSTGQGSDPRVMLRWSDDGGHTWSDVHPVAAGKIGEYTRRAIWRRLGRSRDRVYEVTVSDPVSWHLIQAFLDVEGGTS